MERIRQSGTQNRRSVVAGQAQRDDATTRRMPSQAMRLGTRLVSRQILGPGTIEYWATVRNISPMSTLQNPDNTGDPP